jgi:solute carrier family 25 S-adenosylmethionine transporter 26
MQIGKYDSISSAIKTILHKNGFKVKNTLNKGFYRGYTVTLVREIPFGLVQYPLYEYFKKNNTNKSTLELCLCGAKAGGIAAVLTTPIDVIKTRIMTNDMTINHIVPLIKNIYINEGPSALFKGVSVRFIYISIGGMIFFGSNEFMKKQLGFNKNV